MSYPKIGLALGSGGARGIAHIGVIKVLEQNNIPIHYIAGASIGALVGAYYASHPQCSKLEEFVLNFSNRSGLGLFDFTLKGGLIKGKKIEQIISELLENATFDNLKIPFAAIATDFNTAEEVIVTKGDLAKALRASISVPGFLQPVTYENRLLADGGLSEPVPAEVVSLMGADIVIAVNLDMLYTEDVGIKIPSLSSVPLRSINILRHHLALKSLRSANIVISPNVFQVGLIGWNYFFNTEKVEQLIKEGEQAALEVIPKLHALIEEKRSGQSGWKKLFGLLK